MKFIPGDIVRMLNESGEGFVTRIINTKFVFVDFGDGLEIQTKISDLILIKRIEPDFIEQINDAELPSEYKENDGVDYEEEIDEEPFDIEQIKNLDFSKKKNLAKRDFDLNEFANSLSLKIVDLHIEKLTNDASIVAKGNMLHFQLNHFEKIMDEAASGKYERIIFIHGIGNGILRNEILYRLKNYPDILYSDADVAQFGFGATEVIFKRIS